jgi:alpha-ketoglutarate-dependent taurine dioxygenase
MHIRFERIKPNIGAVAHVERSALLGGDVAQDILAALDQYDVLVFPRIALGDEEQDTFTRRLAQGTAHPDGTPDGKLGSPGVYQVALDPKINKTPEYILGTFWWHQDGMFYAVPPPKVDLLSARRVAPKGGQTEFASAATAYERLPDVEKAEIDNLRVVHSMFAAVKHTISSDEEFERARSRKTERERPLVWTQACGRKSLIIGYTADRIVGMSVPEGRARLARLVEWAGQPEFTYRHDWQEGDLVIWNNSGTLHRVIPYDPACGRLMHRTSPPGTEAIN